MKILVIFAITIGYVACSQSQSQSSDNSQSMAVTIARTIPSIVKRYENEVQSIQTSISVLSPTLDVINVPEDDKIQFLGMLGIYKTGIAQLVESLQAIDSDVTKMVSNLQPGFGSGIYTVPEKQFENVASNVATIVNVLNELYSQLITSAETINKIEKTAKNLLAGGQDNLPAEASTNYPQLLLSLNEIPAATKTLNTFLKTYLKSKVHAGQAALNLPNIVDYLTITLNSLPNFVDIAKEIVSAFVILELWTTQPTAIISAIKL